MDHSRFYQKAKSIEEWPLHHNECGGQVVYKWYDKMWECAGCKATWRNDRMNLFSQADIALRFHVRPRDASDPEVLVEKVDGKNRYISCVPAETAHLFKKAKL
jgi:hypothetical protein